MVGCGHATWLSHSTWKTPHLRIYNVFCNSDYDTCGRYKRRFENLSPKLTCEQCQFQITNVAQPLACVFPALNLGVFQRRRILAFPGQDGGISAGRAVLVEILTPCGGMDLTHISGARALYNNALGTGDNGPRRVHRSAGSRVVSMGLGARNHGLCFTT